MFNMIQSIVFDAILLHSNTYIACVCVRAHIYIHGRREREARREGRSNDYTIDFLYLNSINTS